MAMKSSQAAVCVFLLSVRCERTGTDKASSRPIAETSPATSHSAMPDNLMAPVIGIWRDRQTEDVFKFELVLGIWANGNTVWSSNWHDGGPPYYSGMVQPELMETALAELNRRGVFSKPDLPKFYAGDAGLGRTTIYISHGKQQLEMCSWHEQFEHNPRVVVTSLGAELLEGRARAEAEAHSTEAYKEFRRTWSEVREQLKLLVPKEGTPLAKLPFKWRGRYNGVSSLDAP